MTPPVSPGRTPERGDSTRNRLLSAAIDVFGRYGFDGTSTRALADAAGVNLQAIGYHFQGKEGLYVAAAEHIASSMTAHMAPTRERLMSRLQLIEEGDRKRAARDEAIELLSVMMQSMAVLFASSASAPWARFLIREQLEPTEAFKRVYYGAMKPTLELIGRLVGLLLEEDPSCEHVRLRTLSLIGGVMVFRVARAAVQAHLDWKTVEDREVEQLRALADELARGVVRRGDRR
jgi:AcrR family transcriptional regulator